MRRGRGLVDQKIYNELVKIPGAREILLTNTCNHRFDPKTKQHRVEISEDAWPEVKQMVANYKRLKARKSQITYKGRRAPTSPFVHS